MRRAFYGLTFAVGHFLSAMLLLSGQAAFACQGFRSISLSSTLNSGGVLIGELIAESSIQDRDSKFLKNRLHFDIKDVLHSKKSLPESIVLHYHSIHRHDPPTSGARYIFVVRSYEFEHPPGSGNKENILMSAMCGGHVPYIFEEESDAGCAIKQIFADDGFDRETKAKILSRFVGLYGQGF